MTLGAKGRGVKGVVVLGRVRDLEEHRKEGFPVSESGLSISSPRLLRSFSFSALRFYQKLIVLGFFCYAGLRL